MIPNLPLDVSTRKGERELPMGCTDTYPDFREIANQAQRVNDFVSVSPRILGRSLLTEYYSLRVAFQVRSLFRSTDAAFECYKPAREECDGCLQSVADKYNELQKTFQVVSDLSQDLKVFTITRWVSSWILDNISDRLETIELVCDRELATGLRNFLAHIRSTEISTESSLAADQHEKLDGQ